MKIVKTAAKVALSAGAMVLMGASLDLLSAVMVFAMLYGLISWYMYSFSNGAPIFTGTGLISMAYALMLNLGLPLVVIVVPVFILQAILGEVGAIIYTILIMIACVGCVLADVVNIVRMFSPNFLGSFGDLLEHKPVA